MTLLVGYTIFHPDPGKCDEINCEVCNTKCIVERNRNGPTSSVMAMGGSKRLHDCFWCPYHEAEWHEQALKLAQAIRDTPSKKIKAIIQEELDELLKESLGGMA